MSDAFSSLLGAVWHGERLRPWRWSFGFSLLVALLTRAALLMQTGNLIDPSFTCVALIFLLGVIFDAAAFSYLSLPVMLVLAVLPSALRGRRSGRALILAAVGVSVFLILFVALSEWVFWDEFRTRFNFIAVDYLVYTHEVIANLWQSYPVGWMLAVLALSSAALTWRARASVLGRVDAKPDRRLEVLACVLLVLWPGITYFATNPNAPHLFHNHYANELAGSGVYGFFRAFKSAELDYATFYPLLPPAIAQGRVDRLRRAVHQPEPSANARLPVVEAMTRPPRLLNVVLITVESLSAAYLQHFGNTMNLTPNLDRLADQGLLFKDLYATGTRTVRGLEALSLSVPPTPGESIVKRPHNVGLVTLGSVLGEHGYDVRFVYGGDARFDNMETFFSGNGYRVIDRRFIPEDRIHHENAWGVADEDVYTQALSEIDRSAEAGRPSFTHIMTTSNHRPYTYPEGRVALPSGRSGRPGAVQYTDWAIGDFVTRASHARWFKDTVFIIVADHCASSAGKTDLPLYRYHVPLIIYAPGIVAPGRQTQLASQIDVVPTVLGLLRIPSPASFFGRDLLVPTASSFALVSTYQELGFLRDNRLVELAPLEQPSVTLVARHSADPAAGTRQDIIDDAIALYQVTAEALRSGALRRGTGSNERRAR